MDNDIKPGDLVEVTFYDSQTIGVAGDYDDAQGILWVDLKLKDSMPPHHIVYTGFKLEDCRKLTDKDDFKRKLKGKGIGAYV